MLKLTDPLLTRAESKAISVFRLREENEVGGGYRWWESGGKVFRVREPEDC